MTGAEEQVPGQFLGKVTVEPGGLVSLTPQALRLLDIRGGDYVHLTASRHHIELHKVQLRAAPREHPAGRAAGR